ncbi:MAG: ABC transporter permease [Verrucomicrobia bacterium]|nr:ABC transporter permease [Verrucomicrobiota bacterium]MCH8510825.1 ABC transporter permease [Kiritimatiellia bacterium]
MKPHRTGPAWPLYTALGILGGFYLLLVAGLLLALFFADGLFRPGAALEFLNTPPIRYALMLTLGSTLLTAMLSVLVAVPVGYLMSRVSFPGKVVVDALLDVPIVLPPLVVGLALLMLFMTPVGRAIESVVPITYAIPSVVLAQFTVAAAFAVRLMRSVFEQLDPRCEQVARTLGCSAGQAFRKVVLPQAANGMIAAWTLSWARALGEFGPVLLFAGATRFRTEVLPSTIFLEMSVGNIEGAVAVSVLMVLVSMTVLILVRLGGVNTRGASL